MFYVNQWQIDTFDTCSSQSLETVHSTSPKSKKSIAQVLHSTHHYPYFNRLILHNLSSRIFIDGYFSLLQMMTKYVLH